MDTAVWHITDPYNMFPPFQRLGPGFFEDTGRMGPGFSSIFIRPPFFCLHQLTASSFQTCPPPLSCRAISLSHCPPRPASPPCPAKAAADKAKRPPRPPDRWPSPGPRGSAWPFWARQGIDAARSSRWSGDRSCRLAPLGRLAAPPVRPQGWSRNTSL